MTYPEPIKSTFEPVVTLKMSTMQALWILKILENHKATDSSENSHVKMTVDELKEEFARIKSENELKNI